MALKDIFTMVKADRYTADGCKELNKVREADVEDRRYNIGEISEKTGLQKTANGWVKPKSGKQPGAVETPKAEKIPHNFSRGDRYKNKYGENIDIDEIDEDTISYTKTNVDGSRETHEMPVEKFKTMLKGEEFSEGSNSRASRMKLRANMEGNAESKPAEQKKAPKPTMQQYMKAKQDIKQFEDTYKKQNEQYEARQRMGEGAAALSPLWGRKPNDYKNDPQYKKAAELVKAFEAKDSAPRVLTGDCKVRIRKA